MYVKHYVCANWCLLCAQVNRVSFGEVSTIELIPDGSKVKVTKGRCNEYVKAYLEYMFHYSVKNQFEAFRRGFMKVCNGRVIVSVSTKVN